MADVSANSALRLNILGKKGMSKRTRQLILLFVSFFCGALLLCICSTLQKKMIGAPIMLKGYLVPFLFGGIFGVIIGLFINKIKGYNALLKERINTLENFLPICSNCKRIRKPDSDPNKMDSWEQIESYISTRTESRFSHGICPECMKKLYGDITDG